MSCETCPNGTEANQSTQSCDVCSAGKKGKWLILLFRILTLMLFAFVLLLTLRAICAPMFQKGSLKSLKIRRVLTTVPSAADKEHCTECPKGTYSSVSGSSVCTACSPGHYQGRVVHFCVTFNCSFLIDPKTMNTLFAALIFCYPQTQRAKTIARHVQWAATSLRTLRKSAWSVRPGSFQTR